jgi:hypothetical protein
LARRPFITPDISMKPLSPLARASITRDANRRAAGRLRADQAAFRQQAVMNELAEARDASDAKTAKLRAMRLEKERQEAEAATAAGMSDIASPRPAKAIRRINCS